MKQKKNWLTGEGKCSSSTMGGLKSPDVEIHVMGSVMEVALVTGLDCQFMFTEIIRMFREEGAELGETSAPEDEAARISERLKKFVYSSGTDGARFVSGEHVSNIISKLEEIAKVVSFSVRKKDCIMSLEGSREGVKGPLTITAEIFELTPSLRVVEVKKK
ncbi:Non-specific serine/threonine protein kinase [Forsythia ovata]|uniref:Non-specific serine/threonine protein kinase n=1 Tax=Forsythia ovata TaxID=205694 RepID=A0ABD1W2A7_9LAMI